MWTNSQTNEQTNTAVNPTNVTAAGAVNNTSFIWQRKVSNMQRLLGFHFDIVTDDDGLLRMQSSTLDHRHSLQQQIPRS